MAEQNELERVREEIEGIILKLKADMEECHYDYHYDLCQEAIGQILKIKGLSIEADNQELPEVETFCQLAHVHCIPKLTVQQVMLKANWRKVIPLPLS